MQTQVVVQMWAPTNWPQSWGILDALGQAVCSSDTPNGWNVVASDGPNDSGISLTVTSPDGVVGSFTVRWRGQMVQRGYWMWWSGGFST